MYAFVTVLLGMGAVNSQNNLLFAAFGVSMAAVLVSGFVSGAMLLGLRVKREAVEPTRAGEPLSVRYEVTNTGRFMPALGLRVEEASSRKATWAGRTTRPTAFVAHVGAGKTAHVRAGAWALARGEARFEAVRVVTRFPFGIIKKSITFPQHSVGLVRPRLAPAPAVEASLGALQRTTGWAPVPAPGRDMELLGLREYRAGDSPRQIAWRATARTGTLVTREQMSTTPARWWIIVDLSGEDGALAPEGDCERAIALAASLVERAARRGVTAGLLVPSAALAVRPSPAAMGRGGSDHARRAAATHMVDELSRVDLVKCRAALRGAGSGGGLIPPDEPAIVVQAGAGVSRLGGARAQRVRAGAGEGAP